MLSSVTWNNIHDYMFLLTQKEGKKISREIFYPTNSLFFFFHSCHILTRHVEPSYNYSLAFVKMVSNTYGVPN